MLDLEAANRNPFAPNLFAGQVALVTGGGTGIGLATTRELAALGADVVISSRDPNHLKAALDELATELTASAHAGKVTALPCDIREPAQIEKLVADVLAQHGRIDVLINNAGGQFPSPVATLSTKGWDAVVRNNLNGTFYMTREVGLKAMMPQRRGAIVNVVVNNARGFPGMAHTGAARAGVENLTKSLAIEWAEFDIRINCVAPGLIRSSGFAHYPPEMVTEMIKRTPQKRAASVEECAHAIVYLASPAAIFVTGTTLRIDGGASLWGDFWQIPDR